MTSDNLIQAVSLAVKDKDEASAILIATIYCDLAAKKMGRMKTLDINRKWETFTMTASKKTYEIGPEIFKDAGDVWNIESFWRTDVPDYEIELMSLDDFNHYSRGGSASGVPKVAAVHGSDPRILEVYPIPDSDYTVGAYITKAVNGLEDVNKRYYDVILTVAISLINATSNPNVAARLADTGLRELVSDSIIAWRGSTVGLGRHLGGVGDSSLGPDSGNLR